MGIEQIHFGTHHRNPQPLSFNRTRLEALIADAIDLLDEIDGDPDLENYDADEEDSEADCCEAGDDGCGPLLRHGRIVWGSEHEHDCGL